MPGRSDHAGAGTLLALLIAALDDPNLEGNDKLCYYVGAGIGGAGGGCLPDVLEPALCPNHRQFSHGILPALVVENLTRGKRAEAVRSLLDWALSADPGCYAFKLVDGTLIVPRWARFLIAGIVKGMPAGYASHLVLDALTPKCLPLIGRL